MGGVLLGDYGTHTQLDLLQQYLDHCCIVLCHHCIYLYLFIPAMSGQEAGLFWFHHYALHSG